MSDTKLLINPDEFTEEPSAQPTCMNQSNIVDTPPNYSFVNPNFAYESHGRTSQQPIIASNQHAFGYANPNFEAIRVPQQDIANPIQHPQHYFSGQQQQQPSQQFIGGPLTNVLISAHQPVQQQYAYGIQQPANQQLISGPQPQLAAPVQNVAQYQQQTNFYNQSVVEQNQRANINVGFPVFPVGGAVGIFLFNFFTPGIGTLIAAFSVLCFGNVGQSQPERTKSFIINFVMGLLQTGSYITSFLLFFNLSLGFLAIILFIASWAWSFAWGIIFLTVAARAEKNKNLPIVNLAVPTATITTTTTTSQVPQIQAC